MLNKKKIFSYNSFLKSFARHNRHHSTKPEFLIWWEILRNKQTGYKFLRQKPMGKYILDFYCSKLLLAVEIDGESHKISIIEDECRNKYLNSLGIQVVRYQNNDVMADLENVYLDLMEKIKLREKELRK